VALEQDRIVDLEDGLVTLVEHVFTGPSKTFPDAHLLFFSGLNVDNHPIHYDVEYAKTTHFDKPLAHGLLFSSTTALGTTDASPRIDDFVFIGQGCRFLKSMSCPRVTNHSQTKRAGHRYRLHDAGRDALWYRPFDLAASRCRSEVSPRSASGALQEARAAAAQSARGRRYQPTPQSAPETPDALNPTPEMLTKFQPEVSHSH